MLEKLVGHVPLVMSQTAATLLWISSLTIMVSTFAFMVLHLSVLSAKARKTLWLLCLMSGTATVIPFQLEAIYLTFIVFAFFVVNLHISYLDSRLDNRRVAQ